MSVRTCSILMWISLIVAIVFLTLGFCSFVEKAESAEYCFDNRNVNESYYFLYWVDHPYKDKGPICIAAGNLYPGQKFCSGTNFKSGVNFIIFKDFGDYLNERDGVESGKFRSAQKQIVTVTFNRKHEINVSFRKKKFPEGDPREITLKGRKTEVLR